MKKQFGEIMSKEIKEIDKVKESRKTEILDEVNSDELGDEEVIDELQDEIFEKLRVSLIQEARLVKRFYDFCLEFNSFEYDEMGMNMEEADEVLERANKIRNKLLNALMEHSSYKFTNIKTDEVYYKILFDIIVEDGVKHCMIEADVDSFDLEVY
ncbi:MAG: hypothetical protein KAQ94_02920 [Arcobacteraceae bacterium]|nr:hypothetical protein [Arcobacteraceae bacterium]